MMRRIPALDERLAAAAALFPVCAYGADIGADHGLLSCHLLNEHICRRMCVADISAPSLEKARKLLAFHGLDARADFFVGDGLAVLPERADAIAVLGVGGITLSGILERGKEKLQGAALILSAHTEWTHLRQTLCGLDYRIEKESVARAGRRFYIVLLARPGREALSDRQLFLGPRLTETLPRHYREYLAWRIAMTEIRKNNERAQQELIWLREEYSRVCDSTDD